MLISSAQWAILSSAALVSQTMIPVWVTTRVWKIMAIRTRPQMAGGLPTTAGWPTMRRLCLPKKAGGSQVGRRPACRSEHGMIRSDRLRRCLMSSHVHGSAPCSLLQDFPRALSIFGLIRCDLWSMVVTLNSNGGAGKRSHSHGPGYNREKEPLLSHDGMIPLSACLGD